MTEFCYGSAIAFGLVMLALIWGTPQYENRSHRPPEHPPGWKNIKRKQTGKRPR
jgi:hypothetical protein